MVTFCGVDCRLNLGLIRGRSDGIFLPVEWLCLFRPLTIEFERIYTKSLSLFDRHLEIVDLENQVAEITRLEYTPRIAPEIDSVFAWRNTN